MGKKSVILKDDHPASGVKGIRVPLWPGDPDTGAIVGVEGVDEPNHVVPEFSQYDVVGQNRGQEIRPVSRSDEWYALAALEDCEACPESLNS